MADKDELSLEEEEYEKNPGYTPPAPKSLKEIQEQDKDDESLMKYKQTLLGAAPGAQGVYGIRRGAELEECVSLFLPCL